MENNEIVLLFKNMDEGSNYMASFTSIELATQTVKESLKEYHTKELIEREKWLNELTEDQDIYRTIVLNRINETTAFIEKLNSKEYIFSAENKYIEDYYIQVITPYNKSIKITYYGEIINDNE